MSKILKSSSVKFGIPIEIENKNRIVINNTSLAEKIEEQSEEDTIQKEKIQKELIEKQSQEILLKAKKEADEIIQNAKKEAEVLKKDIFETAREEGYNKGYYEISEKAENYLKEAEEIKINAQKEYNELILSSESEIIQLVISIFKKVCGKFLEGSNELIVSITQNMLSKYKSSSWIKVRVSSDDYDLVTDNKDIIIQSSGYSGDVEFKKDLSLDKGSCIVESDGGILDASISGQIEKIEKLLKELCNN